MLNHPVSSLAWRLVVDWPHRLAARGLYRLASMPTHWPSSSLRCVIPSALLTLLSLTSGNAFGITRSDALQRAQRWVDDGVMYSWDAHYTDPTTGICCYRSDCSGLVSAAWGLPPPGLTTYAFAGGPWDTGQSHVISVSDLKPADALNYPGDPDAGTGHIMLYVSGDFSSGSVEVYEEFSHGNPAVRRWRNIDPSIYLPIRFNDIEEDGHAPTGWLDAAGCDTVRGWAQDADVPDTAIDVHLYFGGPAGSGAPGLPVQAGIHRDDLCSAIGSCAHGFQFLAPLSLFDGQPHPVHAYGINQAGGNNAELSGSPQDLNCQPPSINGVRRHVTNPDSFASWKFDEFRQAPPVSDAAIVALAQGADLPASPSLVQADGAPEIWVVDGTYRRHVPSELAMSAWSFDWGTVVIKPANEVDSLHEGPPWRDRPMLLHQSDGTVWLVDDAPSNSGGSGGAGGSGMGGSSSGGTHHAGGASSGGNAASDAGIDAAGTGGTAPPSGGSISSDLGGGDQGCGCRAAAGFGSSMIWGLVVAAVAFVFSARGKRQA